MPVHSELSLIVYKHGSVVEAEVQHYDPIRHKSWTEVEVMRVVKTRLKYDGGNKIERQYYCVRQHWDKPHADPGAFVEHHQIRNDLSHQHEEGNNG